MRKSALIVLCWIGLVAFAGCAGKGDIIPIRIATAHPVSATGEHSDQLRVAVATFEDARSDTSRLGTRSHLWGGESSFNVPGGKLSESATRAVANYFTRKGWRVEVLQTGTSTVVDGADVTLSGRVLECSVDAQSGFGSTKITAKSKLAVQALNRADGSIVRMTLNGAGSDRVFWFEPEDAQGLLHNVLTESLGQLVNSTRVENRMLRLKS